MSVSRRSFLGCVPLAAVVPLLKSEGVAGQAAPVPPAGGDRASFPSQAPELAREMVAVSHGNVARVKELLAQHPTLSRACWDWGFGDWEDALGAASHVGNREIAEMLISHGARPTIFSAAMLGQLDAVKAFVASSSGVESILGPHNITLLRHAMAGGPSAEPVVAYLKNLPGADRRPDVQPLAPEELDKLVGEYVFGQGADERIAITLTNGALTFTRIGRTGRGLAHVGDRAFFPAGAPLVRIRFRDTAAGMTLGVYDPDLVLEARRASVWEHARRRR